MTDTKTLDYYNQHADDFIANTVDAAFSETQDKFLSKLEKGAYILDFGCGSGRDTKYFLEKGYKVDAMSKVYKMPVLSAFYNDGHIRMEVTNEQLLESWKAFFGNGTNWKDLDKDITYEKYKAISDDAHLSKILSM